MISPPELGVLRGVGWGGGLLETLIRDLVPAAKWQMWVPSSGSESSPSSPGTHCQLGVLGPTATGREHLAGL